MKLTDIRRLERILAQLRSLHAELSAYAKSAPDKEVGEFKKKIVQGVLDEAAGLLTGELSPGNLPVLDEKAQNSDVSLIVGQYLECIQQLRAVQVVHRHGKWCWVVEPEDEHGETTYVPVVRPKDIDSATG